MPHPRLGTFTLLEPVGEGGMGEVWRAVHDDGTPAAVKVVTPRSVRLDKARRSFQNEARAVAQLDHPGIVTVFDYGEVDEDAACASEYRLVQGRPWLAMELAAGSLADLPIEGLPWGELRWILTVLLEALGHSHAHDLVHRDLKPANVLIFRDRHRPGRASRLKLTDFGIAQALDELLETRGEKVAGTPAYMAPEQLVGRWRDCGPWTDLYALGCIAWKLATGRTPFHGKRGVSLVRAHVLEEPGAFVPARTLPDDFEPWVRRLLRKPLQARFQRAADALAALRALPAPSDADRQEQLGLAPVEADRSEDAPTVQMSTTRLRELRGAPVRAREAPPLPTTWRSPDPPPPRRLPGAGRGLFGLRVGRLIGRDDERDALWSALVQAYVDERPRVVVLRGPAGIGRTRLARWCGVRAHELGAAHVLRSTCLPGDSPSDVVSRMLARHLMCAGLRHEDVFERACDALERQGVVDEPFAEVVADLVAPGRGSQASPASQRGTVVRYLSVIAVERPVLLILDDVHLAPEVVALAEHALRWPDALPLLIVVTARDDADHAERVEALLAQDRVTEVRLERLAPAAQEALVHDLLHLERDLAVRVADRSAGNPLLAVQLVDDQLRRGILEVGPRGFRLREGEVLRLPDNLHVAWAERVEQVLSTLPEGARVLLERAAVLGAEVQDALWAEACGGEDELRAALLDALVRARLASEEPAGWVFANALVRETLMRSASEAGRLTAHHAACAEVLSGLPSVSSERMGLHLEGAGRPEEAVDYLLRGIPARASVGYGPALALARRCERVMRAAGLPDQDPRWGRLQLQLADVHRVRGEFQAARELLDRALERTGEHGPDDLHMDLLFQRAIVESNAGTGQRAHPFLEALRERALAANDPAMVGRYFHVLADLVQDRERERLGWEAIRWFEQADDITGMANGYVQLAQSASNRWALEEARELFEKALVYFERLGQLPTGEASGVARPRSAIALNGLAEVLRHLGRLEEAERAYERALDMLDRVGDHNAFYPLVNLGILALARGAWLEAWQRFERGRQMIEPQGWKGETAVVCLLMMACAAGLGDWAAFDRLLERAAALQSAMLPDRDGAWALQLAGELAAPHHPSRAIRCWRWARTEWHRAGRPDKVVEITALLRARA